MDLQLTGRRAIVTGASRGIGLAVAHALAAEGVDVALVARSAADLEAAAAAVRTHGTRVQVAVADTRDDAAVRAMVDGVVAAFVRVDILVNAAARPASAGPAPSLDALTDDAVRDELETKLLGYLRCARAGRAAHAGRRLGPDRQRQRAERAVRRVGRGLGAQRRRRRDDEEPRRRARPGRDRRHRRAPGITVTERTPSMIADRAAAWGPAADAERRLAASVSIGRLVTALEVADVVTFLASPRGVAVNGDAVAVGGGSRGAIHY